MYLFQWDQAYGKEFSTIFSIPWESQGKLDKKAAIPFILLLKILIRNDSLTPKESDTENCYKLLLFFG